jgi:hypothetical protein
LLTNFELYGSWFLGLHILDFGFKMQSSVYRVQGSGFQLGLWPPGRPEAALNTETYERITLQHSDGIV